MLTSSFLIVVFLFAVTNGQRNFVHDFNKVAQKTLFPDYKFAGGSINDVEVVLERSRSPYLIENDLIIERNASLRIERGVVLSFEATYGLTIRGKLNAVGTENEKIIFININDDNIQKNEHLTRKIRLVDGPNSYTGRLQINHLSKWRSVCTNSKNWTQADFDTACRQLGYQKGYFYKWYDRQLPLTSRLLYQVPKCSENSPSLFSCEWNHRQLGSGICDYHPDIGIKCVPIQVNPTSNWRGIRFENALHEKNLVKSFYVPVSKSKMEFIEIRNAGNGRFQNVQSALHITGIAPTLSNIYVGQSLSNGISINDCDSFVKIVNSTIIHNNGYGLYIGSNHGYVTVDQSVISDNKADGIKYVRTPYRQSNKLDLHNICTSSVTDGQTYPIKVFFEQNNSPQPKKCSKNFFTKSNEVFTLFFKKFETSFNDSVLITIYDGLDSSHRLLGRFKIRNETQVQTVTTTKNRICLDFEANSHIQAYVEFQLFSHTSKIYDLKVANSDITNNNGRGVWVQMLQSQLLIESSLVSNNSHVAGVHVESGVGDINMTQTRVTYNQCDGLNITYSGGNRNISRSTISSNLGHGIAVWFNDTADEFVFANQNTTVEYSEIFRNLDVGIYHGNFCRPNIPFMINVTGNTFQSNIDFSINIKSCWSPVKDLMHLQIGHNNFRNLSRTAIYLSPLLNTLTTIEYNLFEDNNFGSIYIKNPMTNESQFESIKAKVSIESNKFFNNRGSFVVSLGLVPFSLKQSLLFKYNHLRNNKIAELFGKLNPRSRVAAVITISSNNVLIFRNLIDNPQSKYEIGSHFEDQSYSLNCTYNWLGSVSFLEVNNRIFHRNDRFNLAKIDFLPFLLHNNSYYTDNIFKYDSQPSPLFKSNIYIGGQIEGQEILEPGEYIVDKDISIRHSGELIIKPGVLLKFYSSVGMLINGKLDLPVIDNYNNQSQDKVVFTLYDKDREMQRSYEFDEPVAQVLVNDVVEIEDGSGIRLVDGNSSNEGRLEVNKNGEWGTVCNYGWDIMEAALVCHQLGLVLNPKDWLLSFVDVQQSTKRVPKAFLSNLQCTQFDSNLLACKAEDESNFENSCSELSSMVHMKCYERSWAGLKYGVLLKRADLKNVRIENAGLFDYATNVLKPAVQIDFLRHRIDNVEISSNYFDGLGITYTDLYSSDATNVIKNSKIEANKGNGITLRQLGLKITDCKIENNHLSGIKHDLEVERRIQISFLTNWLNFDRYYEQYNRQMIFLPDKQESQIIHIDRNVKYFITKYPPKNIRKVYEIQAESTDYILGIQILNPISVSSSEDIFIYDSLKMNNNKSEVWSLKRDLIKFPRSSTSYGLILEYLTGSSPSGNIIIAITAIDQTLRNKITKLTVIKSKICRNQLGLHAVYYNTHLNMETGSLYLRKSNESVVILRSEISENAVGAIYLQSPNFNWDVSDLSEIRWAINQSLITKNGHGLVQESYDIRNSNNVFHFKFYQNIIRLNEHGKFEFNLPYVWQYNENYTHSILLLNNTWDSNKNFRMKIDGHFAKINVSENVFDRNQCSFDFGLISVHGMEKLLKMDRNRFERNDCNFIFNFLIDSQSEILGKVPANIFYNIFRNNSENNLQVISSTISIKGIQPIDINNNILEHNRMSYQLIAGLKTSKIPNTLNVKSNWWNTLNETEIQNYIFDFNDWNSYALADFNPCLSTNKFQASEITISNLWKKNINFESLGGQLYDYLVLRKRKTPYFVQRDLTIMHNSTLILEPGVVLEFEKSVGILVLGTIIARGTRQEPIIMRPKSIGNHKYFEKSLEDKINIRLCKNELSHGCNENNFEGFLEFFNVTTSQWVPICDDRFSEKNVEVVCEELGFNRLTAYSSFGKRHDLHENHLKRIGSWMEHLQCSGNEKHFVDCPIRMNGMHLGRRHQCDPYSDYVFINCGQSTTIDKKSYWGGIRVTNSEFEIESPWNRNHDVHTHKFSSSIESQFEFVNIIQAGILHDQKSPAILTVFKSPIINFVQVLESASDGIVLINPLKSFNFMFNRISDNFGLGINILSLTGEGSNNKMSTFDPIRIIPIPNNIFGIMDMCDSSKEVNVEEKVLIYYKYDNYPVNCIKIFRNKDPMKTFSFRLLNFNILNWTNRIGEPDTISLYDGNIYNVTESKLLMKLTMESAKKAKYIVETTNPSLSVKLFTNGGPSRLGFMAEVVSVPISTIRFNRGVQHNMSYSSLVGNFNGALMYASVGEINPIISLNHNQFIGNCQQFFGNFSSCNSAVVVDLQNTPQFDFQYNLIEANQGGLWIESDSHGLASSLKANIYHNLFYNNKNYPCFHAEGKRSMPYQEISFYRNYVTQNFAEYHNNIEIIRVLSNFTHNYIKKNIGAHLLVIYGLPVFQIISHNGLYENYATDNNVRATIIAGSIEQQYIDNIFYNPNNDYEIATTNHTMPQSNRFNLYGTSRLKINASFNYWGYNQTLTIASRIHDNDDDPYLLRANFQPFYMNNKTILNGECPPGWDMVGSTCFMLISAPMSFRDARNFCKNDNASMPFIYGNYRELYDFLRKQSEGYVVSDRVWVQQIDLLNQCTTYTYKKIEIDNCEQKSAFVCEIDPEINLDLLSLKDDTVTLAIIGLLFAAILLIAITIVLWHSKNKRRDVERFQRRNSIRQSVNSLRSLGTSTIGSLSDYSYRKRLAQMHSKSNDTLSRTSIYKKMVSNDGSIESMEKSAFGENRSFDLYEAHNPALINDYLTHASTLPSHATTSTSHQNQRHFIATTPTSSFQSYENIPSSNIEDSTTITFNSEVFPLNTFTPTYSNSNSVSEYQISPGSNSNGHYRPNYAVQEIRSKFPSKRRPKPIEIRNLPTPPTPPQLKYKTTAAPVINRPKSANLLDDGNFEERLRLSPKAKSEEALLETNLDFEPECSLLHSKSQPLETAM